jgi:hypothetical protein
MTISSYQQFFNFIKGKNLPIEGQLSNCITLLNNICSCKKQQKANKSEECNVLYITFIKTQSDAYINLFRTMTTDEYIVFNHNSHHEIKRIKLR